MFSLLTNTRSFCVEYLPYSQNQQPAKRFRDVSENTIETLHSKPTGDTESYCHLLIFLSYTSKTRNRFSSASRYLPLHTSSKHCLLLPIWSLQLGSQLLWYHWKNVFVRFFFADWIPHQSARSYSSSKPRGNVFAQEFSLSKDNRWYVEEI